MSTAPDNTTPNTTPVTVVLVLREQETVKITMPRAELDKLVNQTTHSGGYSRLTHGGIDSHGLPFVVDVTKVVILQVEIES